MSQPLSRALRRDACVDTVTSSIGHHACEGSAAWVSGIVPTSVAFLLHPNQAGEANMAKQVEGNL